MNSRLTLNLGVRYFWLTPFYDAKNPTNDSVFVPSLVQCQPRRRNSIADGNLIPGSGANLLDLRQWPAGVRHGTNSERLFPQLPRHRLAAIWIFLGSVRNGKTAIRGGYALNWDSSNPLHAGAGFNGNPPTTADLNAFNVVGFENVRPGPLAP